MVVLDAVHQIQAESAQRPGRRAGTARRASAARARPRSTACPADVHDAARTTCARRAGHHRADAGVPADQGSGHRRVVELRVKKTIKQFKPRKPDAADGTWRMQQEDVDRVQEFRKCIECFLCQDVCHVLRDHHMHDEFIGPRFFVYTAALEMHPLDTDDRARDLRRERRHRLLQHHQVLHQGLPRGHQHHRQRDHPAQGARGGPVLRSGEAAVPGLRK